MIFKNTKEKNLYVHQKGVFNFCKQKNVNKQSSADLKKNVGEYKHVLGLGYTHVFGSGKGFAPFL